MKKFDNEKKKSLLEKQKKKVQPVQAIFAFLNEKKFE